MKDLENPMSKPLTEQEELRMMSEKDIQELPICEYCDQPVTMRKRIGKKYINMHRQCWIHARDEYKAENNG